MTHACIINWQYTSTACRVGASQQHEALSLVSVSMLCRCQFITGLCGEVSHCYPVKLSQIWHTKEPSSKDHMYYQVLKQLLTQDVYCYCAGSFVLWFEYVLVHLCYMCLKNNLKPATGTHFLDFFFSTAPRHPKGPHESPRTCSINSSL